MEKQPFQEKISKIIGLKKEKLNCRAPLDFYTVDSTLVGSALTKIREFLLEIGKIETIVQHEYGNRIFLTLVFSVREKASLIQGLNDFVIQTSFLSVPECEKFFEKIEPLFPESFALLAECREWGKYAN